MTPSDLRAWQAHLGYTYETAAEALGMSRSGFAKLLAGAHPIDKRTALACAALAAGVGEWAAAEILGGEVKSGGLRLQGTVKCACES